MGLCRSKRALLITIIETFCAGASIFLYGCGSSSTKDNVAFAQTGINLLAYTGEPFLVVPQFTVYKLVLPLSPATSYSDSVNLAAYSDSKCLNAAAGTLTAPTNPVTLVEGVADFTGVKYTLPTQQESNIYLKGTLVSSATAYCSVALSVIRHFNLGFGHVISAVPGAAGANTAASVSDSGSVHRIDSAGRYVVAGMSKNVGGGQELAIWRYFSDGTLDTAFNTVGFIHSGTTGVAGAAAAAEVETVADMQIDSTGRYVVLGTSANATGGTELALWRYRTDGVIDPTFGTAGTFHTGSPGLTGRNPLSDIRDFPKALLIDSSGKILVTGTSMNASNGSELFVARFTSVGALDATFGAAGVYHNGSPGAAGAANASENDIGYAIQADASGNLVVAGSSAYSGGGTELAIWRLASNGLSLDTSLGGTGYVISGTTGAALGTGVNLADVARSLRIDSTGNYVISGSSQNSGGGKELALWKYTSSGILDPLFGGSGKVHFGSTGGAAGATGANENDVGVSLVVDSVNSLYIVAGPSVNASGGTQTAIWRYDTSGNLDTRFNSVGYVTTSSSGAAGGMASATVNDLSASIQLDPVNTYTIVGSTQNASSGHQLSIWRYLFIGTLDF